MPAIEKSLLLARKEVRDGDATVVGLLVGDYQLAAIGLIDEEFGRWLEVEILLVVEREEHRPVEPAELHVEGRRGLGMAEHRRGLQNDASTGYASCERR